MGKGKDRGARGPIKPITLPLSFPVKGKEFGNRTGLTVLDASW